MELLKLHAMASDYAIAEHLPYWGGTGKDRCVVLVILPSDRDEGVSEIFVPVWTDPRHEGTRLVGIRDL